MIISGEGKINSQTFHGKAIGRVIEIAKEYNKPYFLICGISEVPFSELNKDPLFKGILELSKHAKSREDSIKNACLILEKTIYNAINEIL